ncbi:class I SAM-dependent methyltransferase [Balneola sp. MJW-20]|uniref:class I SAM-dependent methyltransferase n=1 Tax=Gracilimonas aurantiaca TaxID=3234185 RepID=UPI003465A0A0
MVRQQQTAENYSRQADRYENRWEKYLDHTHNEILSVFRSEAGDRILDISAGTGLLAEHIIEQGYNFGELILNDISEGMLNVAYNRLKKGHKINLNLHEATDLQLPRNSVDAVISMNAFHHYAEQNEVIREVFRVLRPGGRFYLLDWNRKGLFRIVNRIIESWTVDLIDSRSQEEVTSMLRQKRFEICDQKDWYWRYWRFFLIVAEKP